MNWHRDIPPVVFYVFGVMAIILLITNPFFLLVIVVLFAGGSAVGFLIDLVGCWPLLFLGAEPTGLESEKSALRFDAVIHLGFRIK